MEKLGLPPTASRLRAATSAITGASIGVNWTTKFRGRYLEIQLRRAVSLEKTRANVLLTSIEVFFERFRLMKERYHVEDRDIFNIDETGIYRGESA
jgi:hypothetical protein